MTPRAPCRTAASPSRAAGIGSVLVVDDLAALVATLKQQGVSFRNDIVKGPGGQQILCEDPSGNVIELFQPA